MSSFSISITLPIWVILVSLMNTQARDSFNYTKIITVENSQVRGIKGDKVDRYLGIPYGEAERFGRSWLHESWCDVKDAVSFGKKCIGLHIHTPQILPDESEDCLNLNVYVPVSRCSPFPVIVWIHGESFLDGSGQDQDGSTLAAQGNVIVVTINYRMGIFGFLNLAKILPKYKNLGLQDQVTALRWVNRNIAR